MTPGRKETSQMQKTGSKMDDNEPTGGFPDGYNDHTGHAVSLGPGSTTPASTSTAIATFSLRDENVLAPNNRELIATSALAEMSVDSINVRGLQYTQLGNVGSLPMGLAPIPAAQANGKEFLEPTMPDVNQENTLFVMQFGYHSY